MHGRHTQMWPRTPASLQKVKVTWTLTLLSCSHKNVACFLGHLFTHIHGVMNGWQWRQFFTLSFSLGLQANAVRQFHMASSLNFRGNHSISYISLVCGLYRKMPYWIATGSFWWGIVIKWHGELRMTHQPCAGLQSLAGTAALVILFSFTTVYRNYYSKAYSGLDLKFGIL